MAAGLTHYLSISCKYHRYRMREIYFRVLNGQYPRPVRFSLYYDATATVKENEDLMFLVPTYVIAHKRWYRYARVFLCSKAIINSRINVG